MEEDKNLELAPGSDLAKAVLEQSRALTALVGQMAQSSQDPMVDLSSSSSGVSTRGALGRAKLQAELATHSAFCASDGVCRGSLEEGHLWHPLHGALWGLWEAPRPRVGFVPGDDCAGFHAVGELGCSQGRSRAPSCMPRSGSAGWMTFRSGGPPDLARRPAFQHLHAPTPGNTGKEQGLFAFSRSTVDHSSPGLCQRDGCHQHEAPRTCGGTGKEFHSFRCSSKAKSPTKEARQRRGKRSTRPATSRARGGVDSAVAEDLQSKAEFQSSVGPVSNPLMETMSFTTWGICLPRWIQRSKTDVGWHLRRSLSFSTRETKPLSTAAFPLPLPDLPSCIGGGYPKLSRRRLLKLSKARVLHVATLALNFMHLGRYPTCDELGRKPNAIQIGILSRLRGFIAVCGASCEPFSLAPGRSGPELGVCLYQLEQFFSRCPELCSTYMDMPQKFREDPALFPGEDFPQLTPYRSLDASRLRLVGEGRWPMKDFIEGPIWLPFQEPAILRHGLEIDEAFAPNFLQESRDECFELLKVWDARGLLEFFPGPAADGLFCRVFNASKSSAVDRQIGDRRKVNMSEMSFDGPSQYLPSGPLLVQLHLKRFSQRFVASVTDRRDFYHQAEVTLHRAQTNMLPFSYGRTELSEFAALGRYTKREAKPKSKERAFPSVQIPFPR